MINKSHISVLDCTLRDGLRIIDCEMEDEKISSIVRKLVNARIDIIEMGFLRDHRSWSYSGNSTFFTDVRQIEKFIPKDRNKSLFVAFVDYGMFDFDSLGKCNHASIDGIRVGFTKMNYLKHKDDIIRCLNIVKTKGYMLFVQGVNTLGYSDRELLDVIEMVNEVQPDGFGIVDTYGAMYSQDLHHIFNLVDYNLDKGVTIDFHSHNNYQLSFALAQEMINLSATRKVVIDSTLNGIGKCAGNLNTELLVNFLNRKKGFDYDEDSILDIIDEYLYVLRKEHYWGYSIPALMAGELKSHPNNIIYLTEKFCMDTKDIRYILSMIDEQTRQRYDYDNIERLYIQYNSSKINDTKEMAILGQLIPTDREVLILVPGKTIAEYRDKISEIINKTNPVVISVNFCTNIFACDFCFFGSPKRYSENTKKIRNVKTIITSNIQNSDGNDIVINYAKVIECGWKYFDNSVVMLLNLLKRLAVNKILLAGLDGYNSNKQNYFDDRLEHRRNVEDYENINREMAEMLRNYKNKTLNQCDIKFVTPSIYEEIFENKYEY